jgi:hypothetical protein
MGKLCNYSNAFIIWKPSPSNCMQTILQNIDTIPKIKLAHPLINISAAFLNEEVFTSYVFQWFFLEKKKGYELF